MRVRWPLPCHMAFLSDICVKLAKMTCEQLPTFPMLNTKYFGNILEGDHTRNSLQCHTDRLVMNNNHVISHQTLNLTICLSLSVIQKQKIVILLTLPTSTVLSAVVEVHSTVTELFITDIEQTAAWVQWVLE